MMVYARQDSLCLPRRAMLLRVASLIDMPLMAQAASVISASRQLHGQRRSVLIPAL